MLRTKLQSRFRQGSVLLYVVVGLPAMLLFLSLAVDYGAVRIAKSELQQAADAAALYAAGGISSGTTTVRNRAVQSAADNSVLGTPIVLKGTTDVEIGVWDDTTSTFSTLPDASAASATAVRVTVRRAASRSTAISLPIAGIVRFRSIDVSAQAIATRGQVTGATIPGLACPWLAGMPNGTTCDAYGGNPQNSVAPASTPTMVDISSYTSGSALQFRDISGTTGYAGVSGVGNSGDLT